MVESQLALISGSMHPIIPVIICYLILLACIFIILLAGICCGRVLNRPVVDTWSLFTHSLGFLVAVAVIYALFKTSGRTALLPIVFFAVPLIFIRKVDNIRKVAGCNSIWFASWKLLMLAVTVFFALFSSLVINPITGEIRYLGRGAYSQSIDFPFYVRLAQYVNQTGIESITCDVFSNVTPSLTPYHWLDTWVSALFLGNLPINGELLWSLVVNPLFFFFVWLGILGLLQRLFGVNWIVAITSFSIFFVGVFGILYPVGFGPFSAYLRDETIIETNKTAIVYIFALPLVYSAIRTDFIRLPFIAMLFGLSYLPTLPVAIAISCSALLLLHVIETGGNKWKHTFLWCCLFLLTIGFYKHLYGGSSISYSGGSGNPLQLFKEFNAVLSLKVFAQLLLQMLTTNLPYILLALSLLVRFKRWTADNRKKVLAWAVLLLAVYLSSSVAYALLYQMHDSHQMWFVPYQAIHHSVLVLIMAFALFQEQNGVKVFTVICLCFLVLHNFPEDIGKGNEVSKEELKRLSRFTKNTTPPTFAYMFSVSGLGGIFDAATHVYYPLKQLGLIHSPYYAASLTFPIDPLDENQVLHHRSEVTAVRMSPYYKFLRNQGLSDSVESKLAFLKNTGIEYVIYPAEVENDWIESRSSSCEVFFGFTVCNIK